MYEEENKPILNTIQQNFFNLVRQASLLNNNDSEDTYILKIQQFLDDPEKEKHIHIQQLKNYNLLPYNSKVYKYLHKQFVNHYDNIKSSIAYDNIEFIQHHFTSWFKNKSETFQYNEDRNNEMISLFELASEKNATHVIQFFLINKELLSHFNTYIYTKELLYDALDKAINNSNIELAQFLTQSSLIQNNPSLEHKGAVNSTEEFTDFLITQKKTIHQINEKFDELFYAINTVKSEYDIFTFENFTQQLEKFLNSELLKGFDIEYQKGIQNLFYHASTKNNVQLLEYTLQSKTLKYHADPLDKGDFTSYLKACEHNCVTVVETLLPVMYSAYLKKKDINKDIAFVINSEGLDIACKKHFNELANVILNFDKAEDSNFNTAFYNACNSENFEIIPFLITKSLKESPAYKKVYSPILDEYPYYNVMLSLLQNDMSVNNYLTPDKQIKVIDYLLNEPLINPQNYKNYKCQSSRILSFPKVFQKAFLTSNIEVMDYFISSDNSIIASQLNGFINENLIQSVFSQNLSPNNMKNMVNYFINDLHIKRSEELYEFLTDVIVNYGNGTQKEQMYKKVAEYTMDLYDTKELNQKLNNSISQVSYNQKTLHKNKKKI